MNVLSQQVLSWRHQRISRSNTHTQTLNWWVAIKLQIMCFNVPIFTRISRYKRIFFMIETYVHELPSREISLSQVIYCDTADRGSFFDSILFRKWKFTRGNVKIQEVEGSRFSGVAFVPILLSRRPDVLLYFLRPSSSTYYYLH